MSVKVKICGVTTPEDAEAAVRCGADAIGLNFYLKSPRVVTVSRAKEVVRSLGPNACAVGVFVNAPREEIAYAVEVVGLRAIQLHGDETPEDCAGWEGLTVIKALAAASRGELAARAARYAVDYVLLDTPRPSYGGSGQTFDWAVAAEIPAGRLVLAGGLTPSNVAAAIRAVHPAAVDVASGVEAHPGRKDHGKVEAFIRAAKAA
jgi:phosphoribosylanthranilate isomerase